MIIAPCATATKTTQYFIINDELQPQECFSLLIQSLKSTVANWPIKKFIYDFSIFTFFYKRKYWIKFINVGINLFWFMFTTNKNNICRQKALFKHFLSDQGLVLQPVFNRHAEAHQCG